MRRGLATVATAGVALVLGWVAPAVAEPAEPACHERPSGAPHGTLHAHSTVPHGNPAHGHIPPYCIPD